MSRVRWECPKGLHSGQLGASRPRRIDIVRYCLECSEKEGKLVERVAPSVEKLRASRAEASTLRAAKRVEREMSREKAANSAHGLDMKAELARLFAIAKQVLPVQTMSLNLRSLPALRIRRCANHPRSRLGSYYSGRQLVIVATWPGQTLASFLETLTHELAHHIALHALHEGGWHGPRWRTVFRLLLEHGYGVRVAINKARHAGYLENRIELLPGESVPTRIVPKAISLPTTIIASEAAKDLDAAFQKAEDWWRQRDIEKTEGASS